MVWFRFYYAEKRGKKMVESSSIDDGNSNDSSIDDGNSNDSSTRSSSSNN